MDRGCGSLGLPRVRERGSQSDEALVASFEQGGGGTDQVFVDLTGAFAAFADSPYDQGLAAAHIAGGEDFGDIGLVILFGGFYVASVVQFDIQFFQQSV